MASLADLYYSIEDRYYSLMDRVEAAGISVYKYFIEPVEKRGIPSFPVAVLILIAIITGVYLGASALLAPSAGPLAGTTTLTIAVKAAGAPMPGASVTLLVPGETPLTAVADQNGIAKFENVPVGKKVTVKVVKEGYAEFTQDVTTSTAPRSVEALLSPPGAVGGKVSFNVYAKDRDGKPLAGALVSYSYLDPSTEQKVSGTEVSNEYGLATVQLPSENVYLDLMASLSGYDTPESMKRYAGQKEATIVFTSKISLDTNHDGPQEVKGSVYVYVKDEDGRPAQASVELYSGASTESIASAYTDDNGVATFDNKIAIGTTITAKATPTGAAAEDFSEAFSGEELVSELKEINIVLNRRVKEQENYLNITVMKGDSNDSASGAEVKLFFLEAPAVEKDHAATDDFGKVSFVLASGVKAYATAYYEGYFPAVITSVGAKFGLEAGDNPAVFLEKALLGSYGEAHISVVDVDGNPAANAHVELFTSEGYFAGFPGIDADTDGVAVFPALPLSASFKARASLGTQSGESDIFQTSLAETREVKVILNPDNAVISVTAKDRTTDQPVQATVTAYVRDRPAKASDCKVCSCTTSVSPAAVGCALIVRSNKEITVKAEAAGYVSYSSQPMSVSSNKTLSLELQLLPSELANNLTIELKVYDARFPNAPLDANAPLERGREYLVQLHGNIPGSAESSGVTLRMGDVASAAEEPAEFTGYVPVANVTPASTYVPSPDCNPDFASYEQGHGKFAAWQFPGGPRNGWLATARLLVKPTATSQDSLFLYYNAWAQKGSVYARVPSDATLGEAKSTALTDWCYAQATQAKREVTEGRSKCSQRGEACFSYSYQTLTGSVISGEEFQLNLDVRAFTSLDSPVIKIQAPNKEFAFRAYNLVSDGIPVAGNANDASEVTIDLRNAIASGAASHAVSGSITVLPVVYSDAAKLSYSFDDPTGRGALLKFDDYVKITGSGVLALIVAPAAIQITKASSLTATLTTTAAGVTRPISDARITVDEGAGSPFDGQADLPSLKGDGSPGNGEDGAYTIEGVKAVYPGQVLVRAKRSGFQDAVFAVQATATTDEVLSFEPDVFAGVFFSGDECNRTKSMKLTNQLNSRITLNVIAGAPSCVSLRVSSATVGPGQTYSLPVARGASATIVATPLSGLETCSVAFNALLSDGSQTSPTVVSFDTSECKPSFPPTVQLCGTDFGEITTPPEGCGDYASEGTCLKNDCSCPNDPLTGQPMTHCTPADDPNIMTQCRVKVGKTDYGYLGASCDSNKCTIGYCNCQDQIGNKYTIAMFNYLWFNYLLASMTQEPVQYNGVAGGVYLQLGADGRFTNDSGLFPFGATCQSVQGKKIEIMTLGAAVEPTQADTATAAGKFELKVSPYVPYAGFAVVIDNSKGESIPLQGKQTQLDKQCFKGVELSKGQLNTLLSWDVFEWISELYKSVSKVFSSSWPPSSIGAKDGKAFALVFNAIDCPDVKIVYDAKQGTRMTFDPSAAAGDPRSSSKVYSFQITSLKGGQGVVVGFTVKLDDGWKTYAMPSSPSLSGGANVREDNAKEPFAFSNNLVAKSTILKTSRAAETISEGAESVKIDPMETKRRDYAVSTTEGSIKVSTANSKDILTPFKATKTSVDAAKFDALLEYDVIGNAKEGGSYADCSGTDFCTVQDEWKKAAMEEFTNGIKDTAATGNNAKVCREASKSGKVFLDALLVALYQTTVEACADSEFLECFGFKQPTKTWSTPAGKLSSDQMMQMYMMQQYQAQGTAGFPGYMGMPDPACNFQIALEFVCNQFFNPKGAIKSKGYGDRLPGVALETFGQAFCAATVLRAVGAIGPGKAPVVAASLTGPWGAQAGGVLQATIAGAAQEAYQRLYNIQGKGQDAYRYTQPDVQVPILGTLIPEFAVPYRGAGQNAGLRLATWTSTKKGFLGIPVGTATSFQYLSQSDSELTAAPSLLATITGLPATLGISSNGYPYLHCPAGKDGKRQCDVEQDGLSPVLATVNKYFVNPGKVTLGSAEVAFGPVKTGDELKAYSGILDWSIEGAAQAQAPSCQYSVAGGKEQGEDCFNLKLNAPNKNLSSVTGGYSKDDVVFTEKFTFRIEKPLLKSNKLILAIRPGAALVPVKDESSTLTLTKTQKPTADLEKAAADVVNYFIDEKHAPSSSVFTATATALADFASAREKAKRATEALKSLTKAVSYASSASSLKADLKAALDPLSDAIKAASKASKQARKFNSLGPAVQLDGKEPLESLSSAENKVLAALEVPELVDGLMKEAGYAAKDLAAAQAKYAEGLDFSKLEASVKDLADNVNKTSALEKETARLDGELSNKSKELALLSKELVAIEKDSAQAKKRKARFEAHLKAIQDKTGTDVPIDKQTEELSTQLKNAEVEQTRLENETRILEGEKKALEVGIAINLTKQIDGETRSLNALDKRTKSLERERAALEKQKTALEKLARKELTQQQAAEAARNSLADQIHEVELQLQSADDEKDILNQVLMPQAKDAQAKLPSVIALAREKVSILKEKLDGNEIILESLTTEVTGLEDEKGRASSGEISLAQDRLDAAKEELAAAQKEASTLSVELERARLDLNDYEARLKIAQAAEKIYGKRWIDLDAKHQDLSKRISEMTAAKADVDKQLLNLGVALAGVDASIDDVAAEASEDKAKLQAYKSQLNDSTKKLADTNAKIKANKAALDRNYERRVELEDKIKDLKDYAKDEAALKAKVAALNATIKTLEEKRTSKTPAYDAKKKEVDGLRSSLAAKEKELSDTQAKLDGIISALEKVADASEDKVSDVLDLLGSVKTSHAAMNDFISALKKVEDAGVAAAQIQEVRSDANAQVVVNTFSAYRDLSQHFSDFADEVSNLVACKSFGGVQESVLVYGSFPLAGCSRTTADIAESISSKLKAAASDATALKANTTGALSKLNALVGQAVPSVKARVDANADKLSMLRGLSKVDAISAVSSGLAAAGTAKSKAVDAVVAAMGDASKAFNGKCLLYYEDKNTLVVECAPPAVAAAGNKIRSMDCKADAECASNACRTDIKSQIKVCVELNSMAKGTKGCIPFREAGSECIASSCNVNTLACT